jgi:methionyl aminopeptidase
VKEGAYPSGVGFMGFPKSVCISQNDVLCHGVPNSRKFETGDWVNFDVTCFHDGYFGDTSFMILFGEVDPEVVRLVFSW